MASRIPLRPAFVVVGLLVAVGLACATADAAEIKPQPPRIYGVGQNGQPVALPKITASLQRQPPRNWRAGKGLAHDDEDALRYLVAGTERSIPSLLDFVVRSERGRLVGALRGVPLRHVPCPQHWTDPMCAITEPIRVVADDRDALHPLIRTRSVQGALGASLTVKLSAGAALARTRVAGPRNTRLGRIERYRATLRFVLVRLAKGAALPLAQTVQQARSKVARAQHRANQLWGSCGIAFGEVQALELEVVDPPPPSLLAVGCGHGLPASGGHVRLRVGSDRVELPIKRGLRPNAVARQLAAAIEAKGYAVGVSDNARKANEAFPSSDLLVRRATPGTKKGALVALSPIEGTRLSDDATLRLCIGRVNLSDGLRHFRDVDARVGTLEERTLIKALDDGDPSNIDVYIVPALAHGGRIGESFIGSDRGALRHAIVIDRAGIEATQASCTLAHELGHVLLDEPGHPDDHNRDTPTRLMDADANDPSAFGPRRLLRSECVQAITTSGSGPTGAGLLRAWPLAAPVVTPASTRGRPR